MSRLDATAASLALLAGCVHAGAPADRVDLAEVRARIFRVDAAWSRTLAARDLSGFASEVAEDAVFGGRRGIARGREEVRAAWSRFVEPGAPSFVWTPEEVGAAASGDLAWSTGSFRIEGVDAQSRPLRLDGRYATVWRKDADGRWRALLDAGNSPASALGPGLERAPVRTVVSRAGDLEAAIGTWRRTAGDGPARGVYLTVRQKGLDGAWSMPVDSALPVAE